MSLLFSAIDTLTLNYFLLLNFFFTILCAVFYKEQKSRKVVFSGFAELTLSWNLLYLNMEGFDSRINRQVFHRKLQQSYSKQEVGC